MLASPNDVGLPAFFIFASAKHHSPWRHHCQRHIILPSGKPNSSRVVRDKRRTRHVWFGGTYILLRRMYVRLSPTANSNTRNPRFRFTSKPTKPLEKRPASKLSRRFSRAVSPPCVQGKPAFPRVWFGGTYHTAGFFEFHNTQHPL